MKRIKSLTVQGFRGFNKLHGPMEFDENITLIYGQNSYGKTSISEALEWLLYGITSKMEAATNNKTEYQGSYRNIHFPETEVPFVEAIFILDDGGEAVYRGELQEDDVIQRYLNGKKVDNWPWTLDAINDPKPFILQHALKNLLLASPSERYQGFTKLIGEEELGNLQEHFISLSTKYDPPREVKDFRASFSYLERRLFDLPKLEKLYKLYSRNEFKKLYDSILIECQDRTSPTFNTLAKILPEIERARGDAINKLFDKQLFVEGYIDNEAYQNSEESNSLVCAITDSFSKEYLNLIGIATIQNILDRAQFLDYGMLSIQDKSDECPLCGHKISQEQKDHIKHECQKAREEADKGKELQEKQEVVRSQVKALIKKVDSNFARHLGKSKDLLLLNDPEVFQQLETIFGLDSQAKYIATINAIVEIQAQKDNLEKSYDKVLLCKNSLEQSIIESSKSS